jgi:dTDP-4-amino-4,6-dideoxygalactose transaminase
MRIKFAKPLISDADRKFVADTLGNRELTNAGHCRRFEEMFIDYVGGGKALAVSSCTAALYLSLRSIGVGPNDGVIVPALTHSSCAHVVEALGAEPEFVDCYATTGVMDTEKLEDRITHKTKAIMAVHYAGRPAYMGSTLAVARRHNLPIVEDCATALGTSHSGKHVGLQGVAGCFSFYPCKHMTTGEGGMLVTTSMDLYEECRRMREFGKAKDLAAGVDDTMAFGLNFRMSEMQAALGQRQIVRLSKWMRVRQRNYEYLARRLSEHVEVLDTEGAAYCLVVIMPDGVDRKHFRERLAALDVETSVYYPGPLPLTTYYRQRYGYEPGMFPAAERIANRSVALGLGPHLDEERIKATADRFLSVLSGERKAA